MSMTKLAELINPQVMGDMISAELPAKLRATGFYKVDTSLTGKPGNTITVPQYSYIGPAEDLAEGVDGNITVMETTEKEYTVKKAVKNVQLTDEAVLSGYGDPVGEATKQLRMSIQDKVDNDGVALLAALTKGDAGVLYVQDTANTLSYNHIVDALDILPTEEQGEDLYLLVNRKGIKALRKDPKYADNEIIAAEAYKNGVVGMIAGAKVVISNKIADTTSNFAYLLRPQALTAFIKRDVNMESQRNMINKTTTIGVDEHYTVAIEDLSKIVKIESKLLA